MRATARQGQGDTSIHSGPVRFQKKPSRPATPTDPTAATAAESEQPMTATITTNDDAARVGEDWGETFGWLVSPGRWPRRAFPSQNGAATRRGVWRRRRPQRCDRAQSTPGGRGDRAGEGVPATAALPRADWPSIPASPIAGAATRRPRWGPDTQPHMPAVAPGARPVQPRWRGRFGSASSRRSGLPHGHRPPPAPAPAPAPAPSPACRQRALDPRSAAERCSWTRRSASLQVTGLHASRNASNPWTHVRTVFEPTTSRDADEARTRLQRPAITTAVSPTCPSGC